MCDLHLLGPKARVLLPSLLDSGALYSVFHVSAAHDTGLPLPQSPNFTIQYGASETIGWRTRAYLEVDTRRWDTDVVFVERLVFPFGLLGRRGIFSTKSRSLSA